MGGQNSIRYNLWGSKGRSIIERRGVTGGSTDEAQITDELQEVLGKY